MIDLIVSGLLYLAWVAAILAGLIIVVVIAFAALCCIPQAKLCQGCRSAVRWYHWKSKTETVFHLKCYSAWETGYDQGVSFGIKSQSYYEKAKERVSLPNPETFIKCYSEWETSWNKTINDKDWERFCRRIEMPEVE